MNTEENNFFDSYRLSDDIIKPLEIPGCWAPIRTQRSATPFMLLENDVLVKAPTRSGKTAASGILAYEHAVWEENLPQALTLEPTGESAEQVRDKLFLIGQLGRLRVAVVYEGLPTNKQIRTLKQKSHIIMGTPGRLMDHIRRETLKLNKVSRVVIDEADLTLDTGFADEIKEIPSKLPQNAGIFLSFVTLKSGVCQLTDGSVQDAVTVTCDAQLEEEVTIRQSFYEAASEDKYDTSIKVLKLKDSDNAIIFCGTGETVNVLFQKLRRNRIFYETLRGETGQKERLKTINVFRRGGLGFLIVTDMAAGGIDFKDIAHAISYDPLAGKEAYIHWIGHTNRDGKTGAVVSLVRGDDKRILKMAKGYMGRAFYVEEAPVPEHDKEKVFRESQRMKTKLEDQDENRFNKDTMRPAIGEGRKSEVRINNIVATTCTIDGMDVTDIGIIDIRDSLSYMGILSQKGEMVLDTLKDKTLKGKVKEMRSVEAQGPM